MAVALCWALPPPPPRPPSRLSFSPATSVAGGGFARPLAAGRRRRLAPHGAWRLAAARGAGGGGRATPPAVSPRPGVDAAPPAFPAGPAATVVVGVAAAAAAAEQPPGAPPPPDGGDAAAADPPPPLTVDAALSEWALARSRGETPTDATAAAGGGTAGRPRGGGGGGRPYAILFVDTYNTCTSVAAEAVFGDLLTRRSIPPSAVAVFSAGTRAVTGAPPCVAVADGLAFRRRLRVADHAAVRLAAGDVGAYDLLVVADEATRTAVVSLAAGADGVHEEGVEAKVVLLSDFCGEPRLRGKGLGGRDPTRPDVVRFLLSTVVDACVGLLAHVLQVTGRD